MTEEMLNLIATTAALLALATQFVDSAATDVIRSEGHVLVKVGCGTKIRSYYCRESYSVFL